MKKILFAISALALGLVSCRNNTIDVVSETGSLSLKVTDLADYITVETKTDAGIDYRDFSNYDVVIDGPTRMTEKFSYFEGNVVELGSGYYTIAVTSPATEPAAFEQSFRGRR